MIAAFLGILAACIPVIYHLFFTKPPVAVTLATTAGEETVKSAVSEKSAVVETAVAQAEAQAPATPSATIVSLRGGTF
jgi:hypothetical protein